MGSLIQNTSTKGKIGMAAAAIGVVLVAIFLMKMATSPSYSTVDVEAESAKLSANALEQQAAVQVAKARIAILQSAIGVGR